jgi:hypothetical protein
MDCDDEGGGLEGEVNEGDREDEQEEAQDEQEERAKDGQEEAQDEQEERAKDRQEGKGEKPAEDAADEEVGLDADDSEDDSGLPDADGGRADHFCRHSGSCSAWSLKGSRWIRKNPWTFDDGNLDLSGSYNITVIC